jgi:hypothetical protein
VVENYIFDSNNHTAILLSKENLDLCCQSELVSEVHFQKVHMAYRFVKHNAPCQYYLRSSMKYNYALSAIVQCFSYLEATEVVESIQRLDLNTIVNCDIIGIVRNLLNRKPHGYQPKSLKCYDELLVRASECYPIIKFLNDTKWKYHQSFTFGGDETKMDDGKIVGTWDMYCLNIDIASVLKQFIFEDLGNFLEDEEALSAVFGPKCTSKQASTYLKDYWLTANFI